MHYDAIGCDCRDGDDGPSMGLHKNMALEWFAGRNSGCSVLWAFCAYLNNKFNYIYIYRRGLSINYLLVALGQICPSDLEQVGGRPNENEHIPGKSFTEMSSTILSSFSRALLL